MLREKLYKLRMLVGESRQAKFESTYLQGITKALSLDSKELKDFDKDLFGIFVHFNYVIERSFKHLISFDEVVSEDYEDLYFLEFFDLAGLDLRKLRDLEDLSYEVIADHISFVEFGILLECAILRHFHEKGVQVFCRVQPNLDFLEQGHATWEVQVIFRSRKDKQYNKIAVVGVVGSYKPMRPVHNTLFDY